jgi:hypothetical protein
VVYDLKHYFNKYFFYFFLEKKVTKIQGFIKQNCFSTSGFCQATQAIRHDGFIHQLDFGLLAHFCMA